MPLEVMEATRQRERHAFVNVAFTLNATDPMWTPPLRAQELALLDRKHPFFEHGAAAFFIVRDGGVPVGRISAHVDRRVMRPGAPPVGFFGFFEAATLDAARAACGAAEDWHRRQGTQILQGPFGYNINGQAGMLVGGFDSRPFCLMTHNRAAYGGYLESLGYQKAKDLLAWLLEPIAMSERTRAAAHDASRLPSCRVRRIDPTRLEKESGIIRELFNDAWSENWGFIALSEREMALIVKDLRPVLDPRIVLFLEVEGRVAGMIVAIPNVNELVEDLNGRLFPFGLLKLLWRLRFRRSKTARVLLMALRREYRFSQSGSRYAVLMVAEMIKALKDAGYQAAEWSWTLEDNERINRVVHSLGARHYKTYRVYQKLLTLGPS